jgi:hypothetical protein
VLGSMLILVFAVRLKWLGPEGPQAAGFVQGLITNTYLSAAGPHIASPREHAISV